MRTKGLTLIELMIVISVLAILVMVAVPSYQRYRDRAIMSSMVSFAEQLAVALVNSKAATGAAFPSFSASSGEIISTPIGNFQVPKNIDSVVVSPKSCNSSGVVLPGASDSFEGFEIRLVAKSSKIPVLVWDSCDNSYKWL